MATELRRNVTHHNQNVNTCLKGTTAQRLYEYKDGFSPSVTIVVIMMIEAITVRMIVGIISAITVVRMNNNSGNNDDNNSNDNDNSNKK